MINKEIDLGEVKEDVMFSIEFPYGEDVTHIIKVTSPCDCAIPGIDSSKRVIRIEYTSKKVPPHLQDVGFYEVDKIIDVIYRTKEDANKDLYGRLIFKAKVIKA